MPVYRARVDLTFPAGSGGGVNSWTLRTTGAFGDGTNVVTLMSYVKAWYDAVKAYMPSTMKASWDGTVRELGNPAPEMAPTVAAWTVTGTGAASYGPLAVGVCTTWRSALDTRRGRGRTFLSPLVGSAVEADGTPNVAVIGAFRTAANSLVAASEAADTMGAIAVWSEADGVARDIVGNLVTDQFAVLRSRRA